MTFLTIEDGARYVFTYTWYVGEKARVSVSWWTCEAHFDLSVGAKAAPELVSPLLVYHQHIQDLQTSLPRQAQDRHVTHPKSEDLMHDDRRHVTTFGAAYVTHWNAFMSCFDMQFTFQKAMSYQSTYVAFCRHERL